MDTGNHFVVGLSYPVFAFESTPSFLSSQFTLYMYSLTCYYFLLAEYLVYTTLPPEKNGSFFFFAKRLDAKRAPIYVKINPHILEFFPFSSSLSLLQRRYNKLDSTTEEGNLFNAACCVGNIYTVQFAGVDIIEISNLIQQNTVQCTTPRLAQIHTFHKHTHVHKWWKLIFIWQRLWSVWSTHWMRGETFDCCTSRTSQRGIGRLPVIYLCWEKVLWA